MNHRENVRSLLERGIPERPVVDMGGRVASFSTPAYLDLKEYLGCGKKIGNESITMLNTIGDFDERVLGFFDIPIRRIYLRNASTFKLVYEKDGSFHDEWGVKYVPKGDYNERIGHPLANACIEDLTTFPWPDTNDPGRTAGLREEAERLFQTTDYALAAGHISAGIFQDCWNLRGMEKFFQDMVINRDFAEALLGKVTEIHIEMWDVFLEKVGEYVDIVETADDLGGQKGLLISQKMYRELIKPHHAALNEAIRSKTKAKIFYHSCGAIMPLIDDLLDIGVDILNPIQPSDGLMEPEELNRRYGNKLIFHGGLDVQGILLNGSPDEVKSHITRYYTALGIEKYIMAPTNSIQPGTPPQNIVAAYQAAQNFI